MAGRDGRMRMKSQLLNAARERDWSAVRHLIECGVSADERDRRGRTVLMQAARVGHLDTVRYLVEHGATLDAKDAEGWSALTRAASQRHWNIVHFLVDRGADINVVDKDGWTSLMRAACGGDTDTVRYLITHGAIVDATGSGCTALAWAAREGHLDTVRVLVKQGANVGQRAAGELSPLMWGASEGQLEVVRYLIEHGADVNAKDENAVTALNYAARERHLDIVQCLVERGADVNAKSKGGTTVLISAAIGGDLRTVRYLVEQGADVNTSDSFKQTAMLWAAAFRHFEVVRFLVNRGANVNAKLGDEWTVLMLAAGGGLLDIIRDFVKQGANVNAQDKGGWTALMRAAHQGHLAVVRYLVEQGANVNLINSARESALAIASNRGYEDVQRFLTLHASTTSSRQAKTVRTASRSSTSSPDWMITPFDITITRIVESGTIGGDFLSTWLDAEVVLKLFVPDAYTATFDQEVHLWHQLRHPNVIKLYGACDVGYCFFVCEHASSGSVMENLAKCKVDDRTPWKYMHHAALGLAYLHERGIAHGSLRGSCILIGADGLAKLTEFGLAGSSRNGLTAGLMRWQSPEQLEGAKASYASDIYALGLCAVEAVSSHQPWDGEREMGDWSTQASSTEDEDSIEVKKRRWYPETSNDLRYVPADLSSDLLEVVKRMCCHDNKLRLSASACVRLFESLAAKENARTLGTEHVVNVCEYSDGKLRRLWDKLQLQTARIVLPKVHQIVMRDLNLIFTRINGSPQPSNLIDEVIRLLLDAEFLLASEPHSNRVLQLSSTRARADSMQAFWQRVNAMKRLVGADTGEQHQSVSKEIQELRSEGLELFISEISDTWIVLQKLDTDEERRAFLLCLATEITKYRANYSPGQLIIMERAYNQIRSECGNSYKAGAAAFTPVWFVPWYELVINKSEPLGKGGFGSVYRARWLDSEVVVKEIEYSSDTLDSSTTSSYSSEVSSFIKMSGATVLDDIQHAGSSKERQEAREMFKREANIWFNLSHPHVVRLFGACHVGRPFFVCEFAPHGSLDKYLFKHPDKVWQKLHEAALGLLYLHECGIVHCDLKCNNIVVGSDKKAKVTDFGLSSAVSSSDEGAHITGAWNWLAPELMLGQSTKPTRESDVFSFAMCIIEALRVVEATQIEPEARKLLPPRVPWLDRPVDSAKHYLNRHQLPLRPGPCTEAQWALVERMARFDPRQRIQICSVVDELENFANEETNRAQGSTSSPINTLQNTSELLKEGVKLSKSASSGPKRLAGICYILWSRLDSLAQCVEANALAKQRLEVLLIDATTWTIQLVGCHDTLVRSTELALRGYGLHRRLDKLIAAEFIIADPRSNEERGGCIHDWKGKCWELLIGDSGNTVFGWRLPWGVLMPNLRLVVSVCVVFACMLITLCSRALQHNSGNKRCTYFE